MVGSKYGLKFYISGLVLSTTGLSSCAAQESFIHTPSMLASQGAIAGRIAWLSWFMIILGSLIFIGVMVYLAYAIWGNRGYELEEELKRLSSKDSRKVRYQL